MSEQQEDNEIATIDSLRLAFETFQCCRYPMTETGLLLDLLNQTLTWVRQNDSLVVEVPSSWLRSVNPHIRKQIRYEGEVGGVLVSALPERSKQLLNFIQLATNELRRLWSDKSVAAVRSLGYALHSIPGLVWHSRRFDPRLYQFSFRIAAFHWFELSSEMQQGLCDLIGARRDTIDKLVEQEGFTIDMYGVSRKRSNR